MAALGQSTISIGKAEQEGFAGIGESRRGSERFPLLGDRLLPLELVFYNLKSTSKFANPLNYTISIDLFRQLIITHVTILHLQE